MKKSSTTGVSGLDASSEVATAEGSKEERPRKATELQAPGPVRPSATSKTENKEAQESKEDEAMRELEERVEEMENNW